MHLIKLIQQRVTQFIFYWVGRYLRLKVYGSRHFPLLTPGHQPIRRGILLLGNQHSCLDGLLLQLGSRRRLHLVSTMHPNPTGMIKFMQNLCTIISVERPTTDSLNSLQQAIHSLLQQGEVVALLINPTTQPLTAKIGEMIANTDATVLPFYLLNLAEYPQSQTRVHHLCSRAFIKKIRSFGISLLWGEPLSGSSDIHRALLTTSTQAWLHYRDSLATLPAAWLAQAKKIGHDFCIADSQGTELSAFRLMVAVFCMAQKLRSSLLHNNPVTTLPQQSPQQRVGVLLPTSVGGVIANLAVLLLGKVVVNLNYTASRTALEYALQLAEINTVLTSRLFLRKLAEKGDELLSLLTQANINIYYLEDFKQNISKRNVVYYSLLIKLLPVSWLQYFFAAKNSGDAIAVILFSSGSEGKPKGVELTHHNILINVKQMANIMERRAQDVFLNALPLFHAFGLTVTTFLPLIEGIPVVCQADPTDAFSVGKLVYRYQATMIAGTATFYNLYTRNKKVHPLMFRSLCFAVAGAEKLSTKVRQAFIEKFGVMLYEGYGATEVGPVASFNLPDWLDLQEECHVQIAHKPGTVGKALPGSAFRIVDPDTLHELPAHEAGLILIAGPQVMQGYLQDLQATRQVLIREGDIIWYKTGDKGYLDADGFLTVVDRYSRFAKIGGEMVSLTAVEQSMHELFSGEDFECMTVAIPDDKKGEKIVLFYQSKKIGEEALWQKLRHSDIEPLLRPSVIVALDPLPRLGTGKYDYVRARQMAVQVETEQR